MLTVVQAGSTGQATAADVSSGSLLDEITREGARRMLAVALRAESDAYVEAFVEECDEDGHRLVVRNGHAVQRSVMTAAGAIDVRAPRVNDRRIDEATGERKRFSSAILPAWCRRSPKITDVLPLLYLHGLSGGDFVPALEQFPGLLGGPIGLDDHPADRAVAGRAEGFQHKGSVRCRLRVLLGGRDPRQHPAGGGQAVPAGHHRSARRRVQGAGHAR